MAKGSHSKTPSPSPLVQAPRPPSESPRAARPAGPRTMRAFSKSKAPTTRVDGAVRIGEDGGFVGVAPPMA